MGAAQSRWRWWVPPLLAVIGFGVAWWWSPPGAPSAGARDPATFAVPTLAPGERSLFLLMIDGLPSGPFEAALAAHELPNLERLLARGPSIHAQAISTFPSATAPSLPELLSGRWAEAATLTAPNAVHAFDREDRRVVRYLTEPETWDWPVANIFDAAARAGLPAVSVFEGRWDGTESIRTTSAIARAAALEVVGADFADGDDGPVEALLARIRARGVPRVALVVFNDVDLKGHFHGPESPEVRRALVGTDRLIGRIAETLAEARTPSGRPALDATTFIVFGDHGMVPSGRFLDLTAFFAARGLSAYDASTVTQVVLRERLRDVWTRWPDAILVSGGSNITQVYLRRPEGGWRDGDVAPGEEAHARRHPDAAAIGLALAEMPGVGQVLRKLTSGAIEVRAAGGVVAQVLEHGRGHDRTWAYVVAGDARRDPFGYLQDAATAGLVSRDGVPIFHDIDTWLARTALSRYPGAVPLIPKAFHVERYTGDLMVTARPGWSFLRAQRGDHGNLEREAMLTPLLAFGAGVQRGASGARVRLVDIYPTAAVLLGADPADPALAGLDGRVLPGLLPRGH